MPTSHVLVVEDEAQLGDLMRRELCSAGYRVTLVTSGADALEFLMDGDVDLVLLDLNLPDMDGVEVAERIRMDEVTREVPILMVTARDDLASRVAGLYSGASDYLVKPFELPELLARVHVRLRERGAGGELRHGPLVFYPETAIAQVGERSLKLPTREAEFLALLLAHRGRVFSVDDVERRLYGDEVPASNTVEVYVSQLRRRLSGLGVDKLIITVRGKGYVVP